MPRDWKLIAKGIAPEILEQDLEKVVGVLQALETQFVPLHLRLEHDTEPAVIFPPSPASEEHS